jgi:hypothetical protein
MEERFEFWVRHDRVSDKTGKAYKKWSFIGWSPLPNLDGIKHYRQGDWLITTDEDGDGKLRRYNVGQGGVTDSVEWNGIE